MLTHILIEHFRCFAKVDVPLRPLTVLIGPNDSGKSTFLEAIHTLATSRSLAPHDNSPYGPAAPVLIQGMCGPASVRHPHQGQPTARARFLLSAARFFLPAGGVPVEAQASQDGSGAPALHGTGGALPTLLDYLVRTDRKRFDRIEQALCDAIPDVTAINLFAPQNISRRIDVVIRDDFTVAGERTSGGLRLMLFFIALAYHPTPPGLILIEEPENGVHPKRLKEIVELLRSVTEGKHGDRKTQVVLSTHSPYLLDHIDPEKDQVLVFGRNDDGSRSVKPIDHEGLKVFLDDFMLGEVWYNEGEEGLLEPEDS